MSANQENKEEEVDLGSLFMVIGNGFKNFFNFIWKVLVGIFNFIIQILLFIRGNLIKIGIAGIIGGGIGLYQELNEEDIYEADLLVQPNFNSSRQLYNNIGYYNSLIANGDSVSLGKVFNISSTAAAKLRGFEVKPIKSDYDKIELYHEMVKSYDTVVTVNYTFDELKRSFTDFHYKVHAIHVESTDSRIFSSLGNIIISSLIENEYFRNAKDLKTKSLYRKDSLLRENLSQIDTLRRVYMKAMLEEAKKDTDGTSIAVGGNQQQSSNDVQLFQINRSISGELDRVSDNIAEKSEIVNVISDFPRVGSLVGGLKKNAILVNGFIGVALAIIIILLLQLNRYLGSYKKK